MIPDKTRPEWRFLVTGYKQYKLTNYVLQMKVYQAIKNIKNNKKTVQTAIDEIHSLCEKYELAVKNDMKTIFNL